jgi:hypothetical protein
MEIKKIVQGRIIQLAKAQTNLGWVPELLTEIGAKYQFTIVPKPEDLWSKPDYKAEFKHGRLDANIVDSFALFHDGFVVDSTISTEVAESFLDDFLQWLKLRVPGLEEAGKPYYLSQLEVSMNLGGFGNLLDTIGNQIFLQLEKYELLGVKPYSFSALQLAQDPLGKIGPNLSPFNIERRLDHPYSDDIFFAQAPLRTEDHKVLLVTLEGILANIPSRRS